MEKIKNHTIPRFFYIYHSIQASIIILFRKQKRDEIEMIRWDTLNDTFTVGQWLMKKSIDFKHSFLSNDGLYFHYVYYTYLAKDQFQEQSYVVKSRIPNFTAEKIWINGHGHWNNARMNKDDIPMTDAPLVDSRGRTITTDGYKVYVNEKEVYDASHHLFEARKPMDIHGMVIVVPEPIWPNEYW